MAVTNSRRNIPESGDEVERVEVHERQRAAEIFFESGKQVYFHLVRPEMESELNENGNVEISERTRKMIERGIKEMEEGNTAEMPELTEDELEELREDLEDELDC